MMEAVLNCQAMEAELLKTHCFFHRGGVEVHPVPFRIHATQLFDGHIVQQLALPSVNQCADQRDVLLWRTIAGLSDSSLYYIPGGEKNGEQGTTM
jgi:hypothetical protein